MKLDIHSPNLYKDIVKKAKKWDLKEIEYEIEYNKWITNIINKYEKFGYSVDVNASFEALNNDFDDLYYLYDYQIDNKFRKIDNNNVFRRMFDLKMSPYVKGVKGYNIVCDCGDLFSGTLISDLLLLHEYNFKTCFKCYLNTREVKKFTEHYRNIYKKFGYNLNEDDHRGIALSHIDHIRQESFGLNLLPPSNAKPKSYPPFFKLLPPSNAKPKSYPPCFTAVYFRMGHYIFNVIIKL